MTTLQALIAPLEVQLRTIVAGLPAATRDATVFTVALACSDAPDVVRVAVNGADVAMLAGDGSAHMRLTTDLATFGELLQAGTVRFVTDPITRGKVTALKQVRGLLRMTFNEGGELSVAFSDMRDPEAVVAMSKRDALGLLAGTLNPQMAVMMGRMRIVSGMNFLLSLDRIM